MSTYVVVKLTETVISSPCSQAQAYQIAQAREQFGADPPGTTYKVRRAAPQQFVLYDCDDQFIAADIEHQISQRQSQHGGGGTQAYTLGSGATRSCAFVNSE